MKNININNISNKKLEFNNLLLVNNTLIIKNCYNIKINITNKINKIIIENSNCVLVNIDNLIAGIEISKSNYIIISPNSSQTIIPFIDLYKTSIYLMNVHLFYNTLVNCELSNIYHISF